MSAEANFVRVRVLTPDLLGEWEQPSVSPWTDTGTHHTSLLKTAQPFTSWQASTCRRVNCSASCDRCSRRSRAVCWSETSSAFSPSTGQTREVRCKQSKDDCGLVVSSGVVSEVLTRRTELVDPPVANINHILVLMSMTDPPVDSHSFHNAVQLTTAVSV